MRILVLGVTGMLGNAMFRVLSQVKTNEVFGTARSASALRLFGSDLLKQIIVGVDVENQDSLVRVFADINPDVVVNCVGLVKQLASSNDPLLALPINAMLPHRIAKLCQLSNARLVHISTDCVFSGKMGGYRETDPSDAIDLYGKSKFIGEVAYSNSITLRTSIIGHELMSRQGLVDWFLSQEGQIRGYTKAVFSGLPTVELARMVRDVVLPRPDMAGVFHVASLPISKFDLLNLVAEIYGKAIEIVPDDSVVVDRSLNADLIKQTAGYVAPNWRDLVTRMHKFYKGDSNVF